MTVQAMAFCHWCRQTLPAGHVCPAGAVGCTLNPPEDVPCGACPECVSAQALDLADREDLARYGSPSDIDFP